MNHVVKVIGNGTIRKLVYGFIHIRLAYGCNLRHFKDRAIPVNNS